MTTKQWINPSFTHIDLTPNPKGTPINNVANPFVSAWRSGRVAIIHNRIPTFILWFFGVCLVVGYFQWPLMEYYLNWLGTFKTRFGFLFSFFSTALFGGLLPAIIPALVGKREPKPSPRNIISATLFWGMKGLEIDLFYRLQAWTFGDTGDWQTIASKTMVDQFIYVPLIGVVNIVLFYLWRDNRFSLSATWKALGPHWYQRRVLPLLISNWVVWIPAVAVIYALPSPLQLPIQNLVLCFWVLILVVFTKMDPGDEQSEVVVPID